MIEFALLFGLGFLSAILAGLLLAPPIHRRIVKFTEDRIMATMPVSPQELRAQKDMVRAEMAVSVARTGHDLQQERHKAAALSLRNDAVSQEAGRLYGENVDLRIELDEMTIAAGELRSSLRAQEIRAGKAQESLAASEHSEKMKDTRIDELLHRLRRMTMEVDNLKIDLVTRDTEAESFRARINALRDERETLRGELKAMTTRAKDAELKLAREENRIIRLEDRLNTEVSGSVDKDTVIERRISEINRLKERLKSASAEAREATRAKAAVKVVSPRARNAAANSDSSNEQVAADTPATVSEETPAPAAMISDERAIELVEDVRGQAMAAADMLVNLKDTAHDEALRGEIANIAAKMIAIVGQKEGAGSAIRPMISGKPGQSPNGRMPLSERASKLMHEASKTETA